MLTGGREGVTTTGAVVGAFGIGKLSEVFTIWLLGS